MPQPASHRLPVMTRRKADPGSHPAGSSDSDQPDVLPTIRWVLEGHRRRLVFLALTAFVGGVSEALFLVLVTKTGFAIADDESNVDLIAGRTVPVTTGLAVALGLITFRVGVAAFAAWQSSTISSTVVARLRTRLSRAFLDASWGVQQLQRTGSLQELLGSYSRQAAALTTGFGSGAIATANLAAMLTLAILVDPLGALVLLISITVLSLLFRPLRTVVRRRARTTAHANLELATTAGEISSFGMELHVFHAQDQAAELVGDRIETARYAARRSAFANNISSTLYSGMAYVALVIALSVIAISPVTSLASLGAVMLVMLRSLSYGQALQGSYIQILAALPSIEKLMQQIETLDSGLRRTGDDHVRPITTVAAENVGFSYVDNTPILNDINFEIQQHEIVGIVGPSGGGKSTMVQLLLGLRTPQSGRILLSGQNIESIRRDELARRVTFVPQAAHLIAGTIADNIRFFRPDISDNQLVEAARLAHIYDDIEGFAEGYLREVGEAGGHLSGGQQQRLCLARALVENPDVLILDEPTSALDVRSEHLVRETLQNLGTRMTVIVVAHRLSTLDICDRIMVVQEGQLLAFDTPQRLEQSNDFYREALVLSGMR